jgi:beta-phosphoglucomutase-like phosphatase (HAD superfamily)
VTRDDVPAPKPAPDVYLQAARLLQTRSEDTMAVEDSPVGIIAAREAGMRVIGFCPPAAIFTAADLTRAGACAVIGGLPQLRERFFPS